MFTRKKTDTELKVSIVGMNERALQLFTMFLEGPARGSCQIVTNGTHEVVIIDLDGVESPRLWLDLRRKFHGPVVVLSVTEKHLNNAFWVCKPVQAEHFSAAVAKARDALKNPPAAPVKLPEVKPPTPVASARPSTVGGREDAKPHQSSDALEAAPTTTAPAAQLMGEDMDERAQNCCGNLLDSAYTDPKGREELFFNPELTLLGVYRQALKLSAEAGVARIEGLGPYPLYVGAAVNFVSTPMPEPFLRAVCARSMDASPVSVGLIDQEPKKIGASEDPRLRRLDNMLWKISLWSSRGRVPVGTSLTAPVRLRGWPNIPRLMSVPHSMRISALWATQPSGLLETARKLDVPYRFVFSFYTACQSFGLVELQKSSETISGSVADVSAKPVKNEKRGLFGSLLKKLGFG
ncbi:MAG: hypothetical protein B7Y40_04510 [Gammaproteobacteria bacterium 28-57-27]|nr:MAG: hypothetical protein B7Y40_04510 [Gammaproteobacteria bacterium 28-57-27]